MAQIIMTTGKASETANRAFERAILEHRVKGAHRNDFHMVADVALLAHNTLQRANWLADTLRGWYGGGVAAGIAQSLQAIVDGCDKHMEVPDLTPPARQ